MERASHAEAIARRDDRDRWLASLFAPRPVRPALHALIAFNAEVARIPELTREPMIAAIRRAWWRETLEGIAAGVVRAHPVAAALAATIHDHALPAAPFIRLLDARAADGEARPFANMGDLEAYARDSAAPLIALMARVLGAGDAANAAAEAGGTAYALSGILLARRFHAVLGRDLMPADGTGPDAAAARARDQLAAARQLWRSAGVPKALPAFLPLVLVAPRLAAARKDRAVAPVTAPMRMLAASVTGRF